MNMHARNFPGRTTAPSRGVGTLIVTMVLLFASTIVVFYLNRGLIFEQKASANQARSMTAFEIAEAGLEWATGALNNPYEVLADCTTLTNSGNSFRDKYIRPPLAATSAPPVTVAANPGCKMNGTTLTCNCPNVGGGSASLGTAALPGFTVSFATVPDPNPSRPNLPDRRAIRITSTGCTAMSATCDAANASASDAWAQVTAILKLRPLLRAGTDSALTCGTSCAVGGSYNIINKEVASNGYLVNAGTTITSGAGTTYQTIPGQPVQNALIAQDDSLNSIASTDTTCSNSAMFKTYFGSTIAEYAASNQVKSIPNCTNPSTCGGLIGTALTQGWKNFYFPDGVSLNNSAPFSVMGAAGAGNGVTIVSPGDIDINGNISIYGLVFANSANVNDLGTGTANIYGAMITCRAYNNNGNGTLQYDSDALGGEALVPGLMVRVPGSWRDFNP
jgi:PilX N-terminal